MFLLLLVFLGIGISTGPATYFAEPCANENGDLVFKTY